MNTVSLESELSDDEIFYGKMSLKEMKKKLFLHDHRKTISYDQPIAKQNNKISNSFKIIEVHSEPEMTPRQNGFQLDTEIKDLHNSDPDISKQNSYSHWDVKSSEDSFLKIEKMVSKLCMSPDREELDNTLDIVDHILSSRKELENVPTRIPKSNESEFIKMVDNEKTQVKIENNIKDELDLEPKINTSSLPINKFCKKEEKTEIVTCKKTDNTSVPLKNMIFKTPSSLGFKKYEHVLKATPQSGQKSNHTAFNVNNLTPQQYSIRSKKTPHKANAYQHITSPVASYIRQSPQVPLIKHVFPNKPLTGPSHIPKPVKVDLKGNKDYEMLPPVAYKSAKKTQVINVPDKEKLPQSPWAKQVATNLPKLCVIRHDHRETNGLVKPISSSYDSFADLSLHQADLSVCTQKSALNKL